MRRLAARAGDPSLCGLVHLILTRVLETRVLVIVGLASYSMFLWHEPLIRWRQKSGLTFPGPVGFVLDLLLAAVTAVLAGLTYRLVERPALARKR